MKKASKSEMDYFINKFRQLLREGFTAHLDLDANAGEAWVGLRVKLGNDQKQQKPTKKKRSPAYERRQMRRRAARAEKQEEAVEAETAKKETKNANEVNAAQAITTHTSFKCEICDFSSNRENGLNIHLSRKHPTIEQLDGNVDLVADDIETEFDSEIEEYLSSGKIGTDPQLWEDLLFYLNNKEEKFLAIEARR